MIVTVKAILDDYMLKLIQRQIDTSLIKIAAIFALIYCLLFNSAVFIFKFDYYKVTAFKAILELSKDFLYIYIFLFITFFGLTIHRIVFIVGAAFLFFTGSLASYYLYFFGIPPTKELMYSFFSTHLEEAHELLSTRLVLWLVFSLFICFSTIRHFGINNTKLFVNRLLSAICLLILLNSIISPQYKILNNYFPIQYLHSTYKCITDSFGFVARQNINDKFKFTDQSADNIIGVLVIGEAARYDHFSLNGYERDTNPYLSKTDNLYSFKCQSCSNQTYLSVPCMLSRSKGANINENMHETGFLSVLTNLGFNTNWVGTQSLMKYFGNNNLGTIYDEVRFVIIPGGSALFQTNEHDEVLLPYIEKILAGRGNNPDKQFLVIHTSGSHWNYENRYPAEFARFLPGCTSTSKADPSSCGYEGLINNYDNSILYTDFFLHRVIQLLKDKNAFLIYASDHAESLGENGRYGHGGDLISEQTTIPFIVWVSDKFKARNPAAVTALAKHKGEELSHDNIFHSALDCIGISGDAIDPVLSLCRQHGS